MFETVTDSKIGMINFIDDVLIKLDILALEVYWFLKTGFKFVLVTCNYVFSKYVSVGNILGLFGRDTSQTIIESELIKRSSTVDYSIQVHANV